MNYEQKNKKIRFLFNESKNLNQSLDKIDYQARKINQDKIIKNITYLETDWIVGT